MGGERRQEKFRYRQAPVLARRDSFRDPKPLILVVCEGKNTERKYIEDFAQDHGNQLVRVKMIEGAGSPTTVVAEAVNQKRALTKQANRPNADSYDKQFTVWAMFDRDKHPDVKSPKERARQNGVPVAFSNPCIELWAILHYQNQDGHIESHQAQALLKHLMVGYDHGRGAFFNYLKMRDAYAVALGRAKTLARRRTEEGDSEGNPYTSIYLLLEKIVEHGKRRGN